MGRSLRQTDDGENVKRRRGAQRSGIIVKDIETSTRAGDRGAEMRQDTPRGRRIENEGDRRKWNDQILFGRLAKNC